MKEEPKMANELSRECLNALRAALEGAVENIPYGDWDETNFSLSKDEVRDLISSNATSAEELVRIAQAALEYCS